MNGVCIGVISLYDRQVAIIRGVFCCRKGVHRKLTASVAFAISIRLAKFSGSTQIQNLEESCKRCKFLSLPILELFALLLNKIAILESDEGRGGKI